MEQDEDSSHLQLCKLHLLWPNFWHATCDNSGCHQLAVHMDKEWRTSFFQYSQWQLKCNLCVSFSLRWRHGEDELLLLVWQIIVVAVVVAVDLVVVVVVELAINNRPLKASPLSLSLSLTVDDDGLQKYKIKFEFALNHCS